MLQTKSPQIMDVDKTRDAASPRKTAASRKYPYLNRADRQFLLTARGFQNRQAPDVRIRPVDAQFAVDIDKAQQRARPIGRKRDVSYVEL